MKPRWYHAPSLFLIAMFYWIRDALQKKDDQPLSIAKWTVSQMADAMDSVMESEYEQKKTRAQR